jgi:hypothetical protein
MAIGRGPGGLAGAPKDRLSAAVNDPFPAEVGLRLPAAAAVNDPFPAAVALSLLATGR